MTFIGPGAHPRLHFTTTWEAWETPTAADFSVGWDTGISIVKRLE